MKVLLVCSLILAGALFTEAANGRELCGLSNDKIKQVLSCMAQHAPPQVKTKASEFLVEKGDIIAEIIKAKCQTNVDFGALVSTVFSEQVANGIKEAYAKCKQTSR